MVQEYMVQEYMVQEYMVQEYMVEDQMVEDLEQNFVKVSFLLKYLFFVDRCGLRDCLDHFKSF